jgi:hypothetical protein
MNSSKLLSIFILCLVLASIQGFSQHPPTQNIRGVVVDKTSQSPLPGANVGIITTDPVLGAAAGPDGRFLIENVPAGRHSIRISFVGYHTILLDNQMIMAGKEPFLKIEMEEAMLQGQEVEIIARHQKDQPVNPMAIISARSFTIDETSRYAGSYGDPARMAANYAGVVSSRDNRNDLVIRGNAPFSLKYQIDGMEILNPNHFGATGTTGGPVTILNTNLLANSDFLTGAFPAEYGNALSGVFDLHTRNGNPGKREYWGQLGFNGLEFGLEGPFRKESNSTYLAAYRYSFTSLLEALGVKLEESADYQDLTFKLHFPTKRSGIFHVTGMGGMSKIAFNESKKGPEEWLFSEHGEDLRTESVLGALGVGHVYFFNENTRLQSHLSMVHSGIETSIDTFDLSVEPVRWAGERSQEQKLSASVSLMKKIDLRNSLEAGIGYDLYLASYADSQYVHKEYVYFTDAVENMGLLQAFAEIKHLFNSRLTGTLGGHFQYFSLNGSWSLEPRIGLKYDVNTVSSLSLGFGLHSQLVPMMLYFTQAEIADGSYLQTNRNLDFMRSVHAVLGYDLLVSEHMRFKAETYYQHLYRVPIKESIPQYSVLNEGVDYYVLRYDSLVSHGTGTNYGLDLTLERFLHRNWYFLFTASLYRSYFWGYDDMKRSTAFDNRYVLNAVGGYELPLGKYKNRFLILGLRATWTGGRPYVPFDEEKTVAEGQVVYDWKNAYKERFDDYIRGSLRIGFRRSVPRANFMLYFDLQYRSNYTYVDLYRIDITTGEVVQGYVMGFYPMATWRVQF